MIKKFRYIGFSLALFLTLGLLLSAMAQNEADPILSFYCRRAQETYGTRDPLERGLTFSYRARTYYMNISDKGEVTRLDSGIVDYYYSFGDLDSSQVIVKPERSQKPVDLWFYNVFADDYEFSFFPNDTGGADLAIGFDTRNANDTLPVGLTVIDRERFFLKQLYLHYPNKKYYKRFSRSFRLIEHQGYIFADSLVLVSAKQGVFITEHFRVETGISDITIYR
ncbi:MAG: hypothetical protein JSV52_02100 [Candidatus Zixiibacteriota bacterium]|nr:MAG: hypothetical protein JSV52_02100 [candidate division Zixibacteria bacterium]